MVQKPTHDGAPNRIRRGLFLAAAILQVICGLIFVSDVVAEIGDLSTHTWIEAASVLGLAVGATLTFREYRHLLWRNTTIERELSVASGEFQKVIEYYFDTWGLTQAERDVALLSIKGVPNAEIARMRQTREGTVKAQNAAIYRKAGLSSRAELISVMVEELIGGLNGFVDAVDESPA